MEIVEACSSDLLSSLPLWNVMVMIQFALFLPTQYTDVFQCTTLQGGGPQGI